MVARLAGDFYPMDHELAARPRIRRLFRNLTVLWAVLGLAKATMTLWLLQSQSLETFVLVQEHLDAVDQRAGRVRDHRAGGPRGPQGGPDGLDPPVPVAVRV